MTHISQFSSAGGIDDIESDFDLDASDDDDPLDAEHFSAVDYINRQFPNEASLSGLSDFVANLRSEQRQVDDDIRVAIRKQAVCGRKAQADLDEAQVAVRELFGRINTIQVKAEQSEALVSDVCRDIKSLDIAKKNLTLTVTALKRLVMLVTALEQLRGLTRERRYRDAAGLIVAAGELAAHFQEFEGVPRVADLLDTKGQVISELRTQVLQDYMSMHGPEETVQSGISDAAYCVDAMGPAVQREVITQFCLQVLEGYKDIFQPPKPSSSLDAAERRYTWLKRTMREYEEKYAAHFPERWRVPCGLCEHFCHVTRQHLVEVLSVSHHSVDPELMVRVLRKSIEFENDLAQRYPADAVEPEPAQPEGPSAASTGLAYPDLLGVKSGGSAPSRAGRGAEPTPQEFAPRFKGIISECFDAYLGSWVQYEENQLLTALHKATAGGADSIVGQGEDDDDGLDAKTIYASAPDLFANMKGLSTKCSSFSTGQTLFEVFQAFSRLLVGYVAKLDGQLPKKVTQPLDWEAIQAVCCVIGTADYCDRTSELLVASLLKLMDTSFAVRVGFNNEQDLLASLMNRANQVLAQSTMSCLDEPLSKMTRTNWANSVQETGDVSPYVGEMFERLATQFQPIAKHLSKIHYQVFCGRFVQAFVTRLTSEIYACRKICPMGAQQLLLDTQFIKTGLLEVPVEASGRPCQTAYSNSVAKGIDRLEGMLRVLEAPEPIAPANVAIMLGDSWAADDISRLQTLRVDFDGEAPSPRGAVAGGATVADDLRDQSGATVDAFKSTMMSLGDTLSQNRVKTHEDLKKFSGDVRRKLLGVNLPGMRK